MSTRAITAGAVCNRFTFSGTCCIANWLTWLHHISATAAGLVYVNISKSCREFDLWPFQLTACAGLSIRYHLQYLHSRHIHTAAYFFYIPHASLSCVHFHEFTNRLGLSSKLSAHNPFLHLLNLHSSMYHSQYNLVFCVQKRTVKS